MQFNIIAKAASALALLWGLSACTTNPATGEQDFTPLMSPSQERQIGASEHPKIVAQFGGEVQDAKLRQYVTNLGNGVLRHTEMAGQRFKFTLLDSPVVNAFALPGGYVYVTRGLMTLANSEAELAGVIGHEIGHVTARHSAKRYNTAVGVGFLATVLGIATKSRTAADLGNFFGQGIVASFSRDQEYQADQLGIKYIGRAGYYPYAQANFLHALQRDAALARQMAGVAGTSSPFGGFFDTHPNTADRVARARSYAAQVERQGGQAPKNQGRDRYLNQINGMYYGESPRHGYVRGRTFHHAPLRFSFQVPAGFQLINQAQAVFAKGPNGAQMKFDGTRRAKIKDPAQHIRSEWARELNLSNVTSGKVNGMAAATATARVNTKQGQALLRLIVIRYDANQLYRFIFVDRRGNQGRYASETMRSFRKLTAGQANSVKPRRLRVVKAKRGSTVDRFVRQMKVEKEPRAVFELINGLSPGQRLQPGQSVKVVTY